MRQRRSGRSRRRSSRRRAARAGRRAAPARSRRSALRSPLGPRAARRAAPPRRRARRRPARGSGGWRGPSGGAVLGGPAFQALADPVERGLLSRADPLAVLLVRLRDPARGRDDEAAVGLDLLRRRLALERGHGLLQTLRALALERLRRAVAVAVELRLGGDDLVEQLALAVLLPRLGVRLGQGEALAEAPAALGGEDEHARDRRRLQDRLPLLLGECALPRHLASLRR